ncbi:spore maturation protein, partial [Myxococcota bacterium]|nr:spore maturation protein [Myxococcota bacterium]
GSIVLYGWYRQVNVYDAIVEGGKEGFDVALRIIPFLVAILVAVGMLRASGGVDALVTVMRPFTDFVGMPAEALPMAILRTLSGSGAYGVSAEIMQTHGPDSFIGMVVSTMQGSTETTFYVMAVYLGAVGVSRVRHTLVACLVADLAGALMAVWACLLLL